MAFFIIQKTGLTGFKKRTELRAECQIQPDTRNPTPETIFPIIPLFQYSTGFYVIGYIPMG
jgi:hypothetical protein